MRNSFFTLLYAKVLECESSRVGIVVGRRVGKAVIRNRLKRIFRELVRESYAEMAPGHHCIVYPKATILQSQFHVVQEAWRGTLSQIGILKS